MKKILIWVIVIMIIFPLAYATITIEDNFDRSDDDALGTATNGNTWTESGEDVGDYFKIESNRARHSSGDPSSATAELELSSLLNTDNSSVKIEYDSDTAGWDTGVLKFYDSEGTEAYHLFADGATTDDFRDDVGQVINYLADPPAKRNITFYFDFEHGNVIVEDSSDGSNTSRSILNSVKNVSSIRLLSSRSGGGGGTAYMDSIISNDNTVLPPNPNLEFTITAVDAFDGSSLQNITLNVVNGSNIYNFTTVNGTIYVSNHTIQKFNVTYNLTFQINDSGGYFNRTFNNVNLTEEDSFQGDSWQAVIYVNASRILVEDQVTSFGVAVNRTALLNISNNTGWAKILIKAGTYNITGNSTPYFNATSDVFTINNFEETTESLEFYSALLRIDANTLTNGSYINDFTIRLNNSAYSYSANVTTTNGNVTFQLINETYEFSIFSDFHTTRNASIIIESGNLYPNYTFSLYTLNAINFTIYDELLGKTDVFNESAITIEISSSSFSQNYTSTNGKLFVELLDPADYRISYEAAGYTQRDYYFSLVNNSRNDIDLYLLSTGNSTDVVFTVQDENAQIVSNATIQMLRYYIDTNNYVIVAMGKTDSNGQSQINLESFNAFYYFVVQKTGSTILTTNPSRVIATEITLNTVVGENVLQSRKEIRGVSYSLTYDNSSDQIRYEYSDAGSILQEACLLVERITPTQRVEVCNSCSSSSSGTILCTINSSQEGFHRAYGIVETSTLNSPYILDQLDILAATIKEGINTFGDMGLYLTSYFIMAMSLLALPVPWLSITFSLIGVVFAAIAGILGIGYTAITSLVILGALIIYKNRS